VARVACSSPAKRRKRGHHTVGRKTPRSNGPNTSAFLRNERGCPPHSDTPLGRLSVRFSIRASLLDQGARCPIRAATNRANIKGKPAFPELALAMVRDLPDEHAKLEDARP